MVVGNLPYYSEAFRSEARTASLYSDFRSQKSSNPDGYLANCQVWLQAICAATSDGVLPAAANGQRSHYVVHPGGRLAAALTSPKYGQPLALDEAFAYGLEQGKLMPLAEYKGRDTSIFVKSRIPTIGQVVGWGLRRAGLAGRALPTDLVNIGGLEETGRAVAEKLATISTSQASRIMSKDVFAETFKDVLPAGSTTSDDFHLLMLFLSRDRGIAAYDALTSTVKFASTGATKPEPVSQEDIDIASLRSLIQAMQNQVDDLSARVVKFDQDVRQAISQKSTASAKTSLRSKKLAESTLQQRTATLHQLEDTFAKIEQAADQVEVVNVMAAAARTLKSLNEKTGGVERIQDIMDDLKEQTINTDEITQALNEDNKGLIDEAEVDDELAALEQAERKKQEEAQQAEKVAQRATSEAKLEQEAEDLRIRLAALESPSKADPRKEDERQSAPVLADHA